MEQHPLPRNITGFQFKLIGDMTLRQFGYLAGGSVIGYALFKLLPLPFVINMVIGGLVFFIGFAFAFLPFQDRPLDQWLMAFIKSVYSPTQFIYLKQNEPPEILTQTSTTALKKVVGEHQKSFSDSKKMLDNYLSKLPKKSTDYFDQNERMMLTQTLALFAQSPQSTSPKIIIGQTTAQQPQIKPQPMSSVILEAKKQKTSPPPVHLVIKPEKKEDKEKKLESDTNQVKQLAGELEKLRQQIQTGAKTKTQDPLLEKRFLELEQNLTSLLTERERLTAEIAKLRQTQSYEGKTVTPQMGKDETQQSTVTMISQKQATKVGILNQPTTPNLVMGVVKEPNDTTLPNILITVKDMRATPLRALKTNRLGQFFASTPLANGNYVLEVEDPMKRYSFDLIQLKLTGEIIQPLEIVAKRQVDPVREKLSKELFQKSFG